jgi:hypothetical protein
MEVLWNFFRERRCLSPVTMKSVFTSSAHSRMRLLRLPILVYLEYQPFNIFLCNDSPFLSEIASVPLELAEIE